MKIVDKNINLQELSEMSKKMFGGMIFKHKQLAAGGWAKLTFLEQMANIGSEVERTINWREKNKKYSDQAFERAHELLWLTISDPKNINRLKELTRLREVLNDFFYFNNEYGSTAQSLRNYFYPFNYACWIGR